MSDPLAPPERPRTQDGDIVLRIGLASDLERFHLPCCRGRVTLSLQGESLTLDGPLTVESAAGGVEAPEHRLQVAALKDEIQAEHLARDLAGRSGWPADVRFDAATGLYRVRLGRFGTREEANAARARLTGLGVGGSWVTQEGGSMAEPALRVRQGERSFRVLGRWLVVEPVPGQEALLQVRSPGIAPEIEGRYRGRLLLYLNDRGSLNLINELSLEEYLRGVVPRELGPALYPRLEALKAQTVAARTYALRHLGEFRTEGFDLCAGVRCQVYGGVGAEHPLSDRAVAETRGQILLHGDELVEALYSATCGGHTEDAELVFPWMEAPYLRGVPCPEAETTRLDGPVAVGAAFPDSMTRRLLPPSVEEPREALEGRLRALARSAGLPLPDDRLASLERREVHRFVRSLFDTVLDPSLLADPMAPLPAVDRGRRAGGMTAVHAASSPSRIDRLHRLGDDGTGRAVDARSPLDDGEAESLVLSLARVVGLLEEEELRFRALLSGPDGGSVLRAVPAGGGESIPLEIPLPEAPMTFRRSGGRTTAASLELAPGDRVTLYRWRGAPRALVQHLESTGSPGRGGPSRPARLRSWRRFRADSRLAELIDARYPGLGFEGIEVLSRGISGRVGAIRLLGRDERSVEVEGLAVRWTLDLPDTRFEARRIEGGEGEEPGWLFTGGGWGHGVGMCQTGAYAMAGRGLDYREILRHYYSGVHLGRVVTE